MAKQSSKSRAKADSDHWLVRPDTIRKLWIGFIAILSLTVLAELLVHGHAYFNLDGWWGFNAWYGFGACVVLVAFAKALGALLKRKDDYYED